MNPAEAHVRDHLATRGYSELVYEPDGNVPPDFLIDHSIAVEVRRLNQRDRDGRRGLEETRIPLVMRLSNLIRGTSSVSSGTKWLGIEIHRPLPKWTNVEPVVLAFLRDIDAGLCPPGAIVAVGNLQLGFQFSTPSQSGSFKPATLLDRDWGGLVIANLLTNLELCVQEKSRQTAAYRARYKRWWLALVDFIGHSLNEDEREQLRERFTLQHDWQKIIVINPSDPSDYIDL